MKKRVQTKPNLAQRAFIIFFSILLSFGPVASQCACAADQINTARREDDDLPVKTKPAESGRKKEKTSLVELTKPQFKDFAFSANPSDQEFLHSNFFSSLLVPMDSKSSSAENQDLAKALTNFKNKKNPDDISDLTLFIKAHPNSRWKPALDLCLGQQRFDTGYLSEALQFWLSSWDASKNQKGELQKAVADNAISNLVLLEARLGRTDTLQKHLDEIKNRSLTGSVEQRVKSATEGLRCQKKLVKQSFKCGPFAVNSLYNIVTNGKVIDCSETIRNAESSSRGTNLAQVSDWAKKIGLDAQIAKSNRDQHIPVPSLIHWKAGHFATIASHANGYYKLLDPTFGEQGVRYVTEKALHAETDGYFLVPRGKVPHGWTEVSRKEAEQVWGKGGATQTAPEKSPECDHSCPKCPCPPPQPMATPSAFSLNSTLSIADYPIGYSCVGPEMSFLVQYNYLEYEQDIVNVPNLGDDWTFNWVSYLSVNTSKNIATVRVRGGGVETYDLNSPGTPNMLSQAKLVVIDNGANPDTYQRVLPDGTIENFTHYSTQGSDAKVTMTSVVDPQENVATISYDSSSHRITAINDAAGNAATTFTYLAEDPNTPSTYFKITSINDPFGRSALFSYNSSNQLETITDAGGNVSKFDYLNGTSFISMLTTPYGSTTFLQYYPPDSPNQTSMGSMGLRITLPDGSSTVMETWLGERMESYFWDREATKRYPNDPANHDYSHCQTTRWLLQLGTATASPVVNWIRPALESPTVFSYPGQNGSQHNTGTTNAPSQIAKQVTGFRWKAQVALAQGKSNPHPGDIISIRVNDLLLPGTPQEDNEAFYTVQDNDDLDDIAAGLSKSMNLKPSLQAFGITTTSQGADVIITSRTTNAASPPYSFNWKTASPSENITFQNGPNPAEIATLTGTPSGTLTITVLDSGLPGGDEPISYSVQAGDTMANIAQGLALAANSNANLRGLGIGAYWTGAYFAGTGADPSANSVVCFYSNSPNNTTYQTSSGFISLSISTSGIVQAWNFARNSLGYVTKAIDPIGRQFEASYANNIDLLEIRETKGSNLANGRLLAHWDYDQTVPSPTPHLPISSIDSSGQVTTYAYDDDFLELESVTDPNGKTTFAYNAKGNLTSITGPLSAENKISCSFYDYGELQSVTDSQGYTLNFNYDSLNRPTQVAFPDGTFEKIVYQRLDPVLFTDRQGRCTQFSYDNLDQMVSQIDSMGRKTTACWCHCGSPMRITDAAGNSTEWHHDLEGRLEKKIYPDGSEANYTYDSSFGYLLSTRDALNQTTNIANNLDDTVQYVSYSNAKNATSPTSTLFDTDFQRPRTIKSDWGAYTYGYNPYISGSLSNKAYLWIGGNPKIPNVTNTIDITFFNSALSGGQYSLPTYTVIHTGSPSAVATHLATTINNNSTLSTAGITASASGTLITLSAGSTITLNPSATGSTTATLGGGGSLAQVTNNVIANSTISYSYDQFGRLVNHMIDGGNSNTKLSYDVIDRVTSQTNPLGTFAFQYVDDNVTPITIGGTPSASRTEVITVNGKNATYVTDSDDTLADIATNLTKQINLLSISGASATANGPVIAVSAPSGTTYSSSTQGAITITIGQAYSTGDDRLASIAFPNGQKTNFAYLPNNGDQRLQQISTADKSSAVISKFAYAYNPVGQITQWLQIQNGNTTHLSLEYDQADQLITANSDAGSTFKAYLGGTPQNGDTVSITAYDASLTDTTPVAQETATYTVSGDTLDQVASKLANDKTTGINTVMGSDLGVSATPGGTAISINTSGTRATQFTCAVSNNSKSPTTTIAMSSTVPLPDLHKQNYFAYDCAGNMIGIEGDSTGSFASKNFKTTATRFDYNNKLNQLDNISAGGPIRFQGAYTNPVISVAANVSQNAKITGTAGSDNTLLFAVHDTTLSQSKIVTLQVSKSSSPETIAANLESQINLDSTLAALGVTADSSGTDVIVTSTSKGSTSYSASVVPAASNETVSIGTSKYGLSVISPSNLFHTSPVLAPGANTVGLTALSGGGTPGSNTYEITINSLTAAERSYDLNGNTTNTNTKTAVYPQYAWDAENRLIKIDYDNSGNNHTDFTYDPLGRCVKIAEADTTAGASTKQFVWCGTAQCEERDANDLLSNGKQFLGLGQFDYNTKSGNHPYCYQISHKDVVGTTDENGAEASALAYSPYGELATLSGTAPDFGFAGMYRHGRSQMNLTWFRQYAPQIGRWLSRDPLGEEEGTNLYGYCDNDPIDLTDPWGLGDDLDLPTRSSPIGKTLNGNATFTAGPSRNFKNMKTRVGVYILRDPSGKREFYIGSGPVKRMKQSEKKRNMKAKLFVPCTSEQQARRKEGKAILKMGGPNTTANPNPRLPQNKIYPKFANPTWFKSPIMEIPGPTTLYFMEYYNEHGYWPHEEKYHGDI